MNRRRSHGGSSPRSLAGVTQSGGRAYPLLPSFHQTITKESLHNKDTPYIFWATLCIPILLMPMDLVSTMSKHLKKFIAQMLEENAHLAVFPYDLSEFGSKEDLPEPINDLNVLLDNVNDWLQYFPQAQLCAHRGDMYMVLLIGMSIPFLKFVKNLAPWFKVNKFGLWPLTLQSEKPVSLSWLLFSTYRMDIEVLKGEISSAISGTPTGLHWKLINIGAQRLMHKEQQVWALRIYVDELDSALAKPLLMHLYLSRLEDGHTFPLNVWMQLVLEINAVLNTKGQANIEHLQACQNTWNMLKLVYIETCEIKLLDLQHASENEPPNGHDAN